MGSEMITGVGSGTLKSITGSAFGFTVSPETDTEIDRLAREIRGNKEDVFTRALALLKWATTLLTTVGTGGVGSMTGKGSRV